MRKVVLYIAVSLDGYIADLNGGVGWLGGDESDNENPGTYNDFIKTVDDIIFGYNTYQQIVNELNPDGWPYVGKKSYVLTHRYPVKKDNIEFVNIDIVTLINDLKKEDGKKIWICGGATIVTQAMKYNLIDEYIVEVMPIILGNGIRLFEPQRDSQKLKLVSLKSFNGIVSIHYEKK